MKTLVVIAVGALALCASVAHAQQKTDTFTFKSLEDAAKELPCQAFAKNDDGSWTSKVTLVIGGKSSSGDTFKNSRESKILDTRCGRARTAAP
jgi:hypothetical protein